VAVEEQLTTAEELIRNADLAMSAAKLAGNGEVRFFELSMHEGAVLRLELISDLPPAIDAGQFTVHYQPIVTLADHAVVGGEAIVGAEALVRWKHPRLGLIPPGVFIGLAEQAGLIAEIGRFVLAQACDQLEHWRETLEGRRGLFVTVNVSPLQLHSSGLLSEVEAALDRSGLPSDHLVLEITESVLCDPGSDVARRLSDLKRLGVRLAVDDFGTGYSALSYLQDMPLDILKIDKSFIDGLAGSNDNDQLVAGIIDLAHRMRLQTLAEGIETDAQASTLAAMKSELGQGFLFAKPLPPEEFELLLTPTEHPAETPERQHADVRGPADAETE
jgi:EAL domain-containing protein (putative c-di-GMP-specific phosphodiesterase class I)